MVESSKMKNFNYTELLQKVSQRDLSRVGGKAAHLGEMIRAGLPVPEGFVLCTDSYRRFTSFNKIDAKIEELVKKHGNDIFKAGKGSKELSDRIKTLFEEGELPEDLIDEINWQYEKIGSPEVVVRSSATQEDSPTASCAGQYDSFLNVKDVEQLHKYIKQCWASLWNTRALSYRLTQKIDDPGPAHAVVVQKLIQAEKSGILFTANPINNRRDQMLINSSWGLGEAQVSGDVTPEQIIVRKHNEAGLQTELQEISSLDQRDVLELVELGTKAEAHFTLPQDIEWAYSDSQFSLVQSRPITTLFPKLKPENSDEKLRVYINFLLVDKVMPEPLTPIGEDIWKKFLEKILPPKWIKSAAGRLFVDATELSRMERWWDKLRDNPSSMDPLTTIILLEVLERNKSELKQQRKPLITLIPTIFGMLNLPLVKFLLTSMPKTLYGLFFSPEKVVKKAAKCGENEIKSLKEKAQKLHTREEKIEFIEKNAPTVYYFLPLKVLYYVVSSITCLDKAKKIVSTHLKDTSKLNKIEKSLPHNITTEMGMQLLRIARNLDRNGEQPTPEHPEIQDFLNTYGHRAYLEVDPGIPRWKEKPEYVINLLNSYISNKSYDERIKKFSQDKEEAEQAILEITLELKEKGARRDAGKVEKLLNKYRNLFGVRELPKHIMVKGVDLFRDILLEIGEELAAEGRLDSKQDVFFVRFQDITSGSDQGAPLQKQAPRNQSLYQKELKRSSIPRVVTSTGETLFSPAVRNRDNILEGIPVSPGLQEGRVRILEYPEEGNKLKKDDILVTKAANPAWTPLFLEIGGLITEMGSPLSHGSVVAREYGVPAVTGLQEATTRLKDGQLIRLNGETGVVELLD